MTAREIVPIYESPCAVYDAGDACSAPPDASGAYVAAWTSLPCIDVCAALDTDEPGPLLACDPVRLALPNEDHAGFYVVSCTFESETSQ